MGPMLAPWTLLSGMLYLLISGALIKFHDNCNWGMMEQTFLPLGFGIAFQQRTPYKPHFDKVYVCSSYPLLHAIYLSAPSNLWTRCKIATGSHSVDIELCNGLWSDSTKPLPKPMLTQIYVAYGITGHQWVNYLDTSAMHPYQCHTRNSRCCSANDHRTYNSCSYKTCWCKINCVWSIWRIMLLYFVKHEAA